MADKIEYELVRMKRKTISIEITKAAGVLVKAPRQLASATVEAFVARKSNWITETRQRVLEENRKKENFDPLRSRRLLFLGKEYPVQTADDPDAAPLFDGARFLLPARPFSQLRPLLVALYKQLAEAVITERVHYYAALMGVRPSSVKITSAKTRWGSCSGKNGICFSWKLIFAALSAVDYVVVHELAHIKEHNHSARFWAVVSGVLPDYRQRQSMLKQLQQRLNGEQWE